jgi:uncharacterized membrane protein
MSESQKKTHLSHDRKTNRELPRIFMSLNRLETLGDAIFAFSLTLLAFDLKVPDGLDADMGKGLYLLLPKLVIFIFTFLVVAQHWDVHQRTLRYVVHADGTFIWLTLLSLMFIVLLPTSADFLGKYPQQPASLIFFGGNLALFSLVSWFQWNYATGSGHLVMENLDPEVIKMIKGLWLSTPIIIGISIPISFISVYPVYVIWMMMPILSYVISIRTIHRIKNRSIQAG